MKAAAHSVTAAEVLEELKTLGSVSYKKMLMTNHGIREPFFGVKIGDMKKIQKRIKKDYQLSLDLYDSGNFDAMYLAGLIADDSKMTPTDLQRWADGAYSASLAGFTVAWVAAESRHGWVVALQWIESRKDLIAVAGWSTLAALVALQPDADLDVEKLKNLMARVQKTIHHVPDAVRYAMNNFIIAVGCYANSLSREALQTAEEIGPVTADLGNNSCQIPFAPDCIRKAEARGTIGKKRKTVKC